MQKTKPIYLLPLLLLLHVASCAQGVYLIAHRGGVVDSTNVENSLPALASAIKNGYKAVEMDVRLTKDSVLIIQHDRDLKRYYGIDSNVADMPWARLSQLVSNKGSKIATLEDEFKHCSGKVQVMLDNKIKGNDTLLWKRMITLLKKYNLFDSAIMIGTDESSAWFTGKIKLSCTRQQLEENSHKPEYNPAYFYLFGGVKSMTPDDIQWAAQRGIMVIGAVNLFSYKKGDLSAAFKDIETLKSWGITRFQIDSELQPAFVGVQ